jgi:glycosyltransferase involved in cell wall biosynthesis
MDAETYFQFELERIRLSGLFLAPWYMQRFAEAAAAGGDPLVYFCQQGWRLGDQPNPYFDPAYYLSVNQDVARAGVNPLLHYILYGDAEGRDPCRYFDVKWYRDHYQVALRENTLRHFLERRFSGEVAPVPLFDPVYYLESNPDVASAGSDPFEHFLAFGPSEGRNPSADFDMKFYTARYGGVLNGLNPLLHYLANRESGQFAPARPDHEKLIPGAVRRATRPSPFFEEFRPVPANAERRARLLAYYLPQFHPVPENDAWWGKGFTDWTNLARALPRFAGHLQPRVPRDLGYYTLDDPNTLRRQIELATGAGIAGFVFYYYWFNGRRLLETPLNLLLADASLNMPFCAMWANENFTRRWDGLEREVLMTQEYREADDEGLIAGFAALFTDARYIRIQNRPLLMIYRASLIPDPARRIARWRDMFARQHGENPIIIMAQSLGDYDPTPYGLDGAVEFPPHKISDEVPRINDTLDLFDQEFSAAVYDYQAIANASLAAASPGYPLIKTIAPGWDNDPRREGKGLVLHGATPAKYEAWLDGLVERAAEQRFFGERVVCVNAWNEWAEGAFLEPDIHFGAAFLNATGRAVCGAEAGGKTRLLLVGHDAHPHGAQLLLLSLARHYARVWGFEVHMLLLGAGPLVGAYQQVAQVTLTNDKAAIANLINHYDAIGIRTAIVNSAASARLVPALTGRGIVTTLLIHEMPKLLAEYNLQMQGKLGAASAKQVVFASEFGRDSFCGALGISPANTLVLPQGNYNDVTFSAEARREMRARLGVGETGFLVLGAGFGDLRKGFDLFLQMAGKILAARGDVHFVWLGEIQPSLKTYLGGEIAAAQATGRLHLPGFTQAAAAYFSAADVFALTSREDPYPNVALEALAAGTPVVAFAGSGGIPELLNAHKAGAVAADADEFRRHLLRLLNHKKHAHEKHAQDRQRLVRMAAESFSQTSYARALLLAARPRLKTVSACVLNYNYAKFLRPRLGSVFEQTYPVCEVLFLDDGSTDDSVALAQEIAAAQNRELTVIENARNAGSVFAQWRRAAERATGAYVWIAEADDRAAPEFLSRVVEAMAAAGDAVLGFCDSQVIDAAGKMTAPGYRALYVEAGAAPLAASGVWPARVFATEFLAVQNLIFNASAVVWRRDALLAALRRCDDTIATWRVAGDWRLYMEALTAGQGEVVYVATALNSHRRHGGSAIGTISTEIHLREITEMQRIAAERLDLGARHRAAQVNYLNFTTRQLLKSKINTEKVKKPRSPRRTILASSQKV